MLLLMRFVRVVVEEGLVFLLLVVLVSLLVLAGLALLSVRVLL